ncbi:GspH/FimT family pseudopilin [Xanthomonas albilineans]|uniref:GspH/FimT family pseudopilin n=1 Tax=Xanthomonas albilineans TaxID=29447 RepID=UPI0005F3498C|nr:GspH/FimT family pseudopilin [Xanthomonas albilineans]
MRKVCNKGYTLLEAMIVMALICIVTGIGLPGFRELRSSHRLTATIHQISTYFALARNSAISSGIPVSVCPSRGDGRCRRDSDWSQGWMVFRDPERRGQPDTPTSILSQETAPAIGSLVVLSSQDRSAIRFFPDGLSSGSNLTVRICERGRLRAKVVVNNSGRTRSVKAKGERSCLAPD